MQRSNPMHALSWNSRRNRALCWYFASLSVLAMGIVAAARYYPGGYDWSYTVVSALASQKHNPTGSIWFAAAFSLAMILLWPYVSALKKQLAPSLPATKFAIIALRIGLVAGFLLGLERLLIYDLSAWVYKAHEALGILSYGGWFIGVLGVLVAVIYYQRIYILPAFLVAVPLLAIAITQLWLYFEQRDLGWVNTSWREMGIPIWLSFAFWQWLAIAFLEISLGLVSFISIKENKS